jgi:membrane protein implicated in regulation of membrane protease activity
MSGTRSALKTVPATESLWRLGLILWPFATAAVAINLFMLGLLATWLGLPNIPPYTAIWAALPLGLPATWAAARWVRHLIRTAEGRKG